METRTLTRSSGQQSSDDAYPRTPSIEPPSLHPDGWAAVAWRYVGHPVVLATLTAAVLHLLWVWLVANSGGDLAAQDAWAEFARDYPGSAYNLAWFGGMHPISYSVISPYIMATLGVRTTMMLAGTLSAALLALLLCRVRSIRQPLWPALYGAFALTGNAVSGRVTFGVGVLFGLAAVAVICVWPDRLRTTRLEHRVPRAILAALLSALATAASPVAGLFVGVVAAALWLEGRRAAAYVLGIPPTIVVAVSAQLFPFSGEQPMGVISAILPVILGCCAFALAPTGWRTVRIAAMVYAVGVVLVWLVPSQIGTNVTRLALLIGGVVLVAVTVADRGTPTGWQSRWPGSWRLLLVLAIATSSIWQVGTAVRDVVSTQPSQAWTFELAPLVKELEMRNADLARVEVVPSQSHREASALAPHVNLARGWNRQADAEENPIFYDDDLLTADSYRQWLERWAVGYVVLPDDDPDRAAEKEAHLIAGGLDYLDLVWANRSWRLYEVIDPTPLAAPPATVTRFDPTAVVLTVPTAGEVLVRIPYSPWLSLLDGQGDPVEAPKSLIPDGSPVNLYGCLTKQENAFDQPEDEWTVLHAPRPGTYVIAAPYKVPRGTACPDDLVE